MPRLRQLCPGIPAPLELPPEQERRFLFNSMWEVLARTARIKPTLLVFDDIHWAAASAVSYATRARGERKRPSSGWGSLTPTEVEVVRLVVHRVPRGPRPSLWAGRPACPAPVAVFH